jgi:hypothetical protein
VARGPNVNFTIPLEEQIRAAQGTPAFIRRARRLEILSEKIYGRLQEFHEQEMGPVTEALRRIVTLLRRGVEGSRVRGALRRAVADLGRRVDAYNIHRGRFLDSLDLEEFNAAVRGYHRNYLIEREAWCRSSRGAEGMARWSALSRTDLEEKLPALRRP